jgi:probable DNA repair protein
VLYQVQDICAAAQRGAVIITVNQRMTRTLKEEYQHWQQRQGADAWAVPQIFTSQLWWRRCLMHNPSIALLLNPAQQDVLWYDIIRADLKQQEYALLQIGATVKQALKAYAMLCEHLVEPDSYSASTPEEHAFKRWCTAYLEYCDTHTYLDQQRLGTFMRNQFDTGAIQVPDEVWLVGFDEVTPQLRSVCEVLQLRGTRIVEPQIDARLACTRVFSCADPRAELQHAISWALRHIAAGKRVGIVVPELERHASTLEQIFTEHARACTEENEIAGDKVELNLSLGRSLSDYGVIHAALKLLQVEDPVELNTLGSLLRSPWLAGGLRYMDEHARADAQLRASLRPRAPLDNYVRLLEHKGLCTCGIDAIVGALRELCAIRDFHPPQIWADIFVTTLHKAGWPGDYAPDSETYQILQAWDEQILPRISSLSAVKGDISRMDAARLLVRLCEDSVFQPGAHDRRLQVVGLLEGVALACDAVWVSGLHSQVLPAPLAGNTFIPVQVQKKHTMPRASMEREIEFSTRLMRQFHTLADEVVFSYPLCTEDGNTCTPSPFLPLPACGVQDLSDLPETCAFTDKAAILDVVPDSHGIPLEVEYQGHNPPYAVKGGTYLLKAQAACPFKAYAGYRMRISALETPSEGVDMRVRGSMLHLLLQRFWDEIKTQEELLRRDEASIRNLLEQMCAAILEENSNACVPAEFHALERRRLADLALEWLEIERSRPPFRVLSVEESDAFQVGSLHLTAVADRVDENLHDTSVILIDYKTGIVSLKDIVGETLLEPQLPMYAVYGKHQPVSGVGIAQVRAGECAVKGVCLSCADTPAGSSPLKRMNEDEWKCLWRQWEHGLEQLAEDVASAYAAVAPVNAQVCQFCELHPLCRIRDNSADVDADEEQI